MNGGERDKDEMNFSKKTAEGRLKKDILFYDKSYSLSRVW